MLGVKEYGGELVKAGSILIRQRGSEFDPGANVGQGRDYTLYSKIAGYVKFEGFKKNRRISVYPENPYATTPVVAADVPAPETTTAAV
jgi:large subunit ribosomal protein L27